jgi:hypothetical protein
LFVIWHKLSVESLNKYLFIPFRMKRSGLIDALISMRPEIVPLRLNKVGRHVFTAISVEIAQGGHQAGDGIADMNGMDDDIA